MNQDPFAAYRINKAPASQVEQPKQMENTPFDKYRIKKAQGAPFLYETGRHAARIGSRVAEAIGGIPGDVESLIQSGIFAGLEKLTGHKVKNPEKERELPTTHELGEFSKKATKEFTAPQSEFERAGDEFVQTAASLLGPGKFKRAIGIAAGSQLAKEGVKVAGLGEAPQEVSKLGTMVFLSILNPGGAMKYASQNYAKANELAKGASIAAPKLQSELTNLILDLDKGVETAAKNAVKRPAEDLLKKITNGKVPVQELTAAKRDLNTIMKDPALLKREKILLKKLGRDIDNAIKPYEKINPAFKNAYRPANEIYGAIMQGNKYANYIKNTLGSKALLAATVEAAAGHPEFILPTIAGYAGLHGSAMAMDFLNRLRQSPQLRKYYYKALEAAAKEDAKSLRLYSDKIEKSIER